MTTAIAQPTLATRLRQDFPLLQNGTFAFLDTAASSQTPAPVLDAMDRYYREYRANVHRGMYQASERATVAYEDARTTVGRFIGARTEEIVFTRGTTESLNLLAYSLGPTLGPGDEMVLSIMEHHANLVPWQQMAKRYGFAIRWVPITSGYLIDVAKLREMVTANTKIVSIAHASNVLGTLAPVREIAAIIREQAPQAMFIVDAAQTASHVPVNVKSIGCDFLAFSGHKMLGPTGIGVLFGKKERLAALAPFQFGGDMISDVTLEESKWNDAPWRFEAGTPNIAGAIGLAAAVDYIGAIGMDAIVEHEREMTAYAIGELEKIPGVEIIGPAAGDRRVGAISFVACGIHPHDVATIADTENVGIRGGHHCAMPLMRELGLKHGTSRASIGVYTSREDIDALIRTVRKAKHVFRRIS